MVLMVATYNGRVLGKCASEDTLEQNNLNVPTPTPLPGRNVPKPYVCTGDDAFPFSTYMIKPYPQSNMTVKKRIFNTGCQGWDTYPKTVFEY